MDYEYKFLSENSVPGLYAAFMEAFKDYFMDASAVTYENFHNRAIKNGADYESSVGVFADGQMVGFTVVGVDSWKGEKAAFDIVTGIIKQHRGKGIASNMFNFSLPRLREKGVRKFVLEVLQENEAAIKAYQKTGFIKSRAFDCFLLKIENADFAGEVKLSISIDPIGKDEIEHYESYIDWHPSWENSFASIRRIPDDVKILGAEVNGEKAGMIAYYPLMNWIHCIAIKQEFRRQGVGTALLHHLIRKTDFNRDDVRLINVQDDDAGMILFLDNCGFEIYARQFEMELEL